jgi:hypothetical protein
MNTQDPQISPASQVSKPLFILVTAAMVIVWFFKIGWISGIGYLLGFSFLKRWIVLGISKAAKLESEDDFSAFQSKIVTGLVLVHLGQLGLLIFMLR